MKFQVNQRYWCKSVCDHNAKWYFKVVKRTKCFIWIKAFDKTAEFEVGKFRVKTDHNGDEFVRPFGQYSMSPILNCSRIWEEQ